jgi:hypothetical protein
VRRVSLVGFCFAPPSPHWQRPSMQIAASLFERKLAVHLTYSRGRCFRRSSQSSSLLWFTKSKCPLMSKVRAGSLDVGDKGSDDIFCRGIGTEAKLV